MLGHNPSCSKHIIIIDEIQKERTNTPKFKNNINISMNQKSKQNWLCKAMQCGAELIWRVCALWVCELADMAGNSASAGAWDGTTRDEWPDGGLKQDPVSSKSVRNLLQATLSSQRLPHPTRPSWKLELNLLVTMIGEHFWPLGRRNSDSRPPATHKSAMPSAKRACFEWPSRQNLLELWTMLY